MPAGQVHVDIHRMTSPVPPPPPARESTRDLFCVRFFVFTIAFLVLAGSAFYYGVIRPNFPRHPVNATLLHELYSSTGAPEKMDMAKLPGFLH